MTSKADKKEPLLKAVSTKFVWMLVSKKFIAFAVGTVLLIYGYISDNVWLMVALGFIGAVVAEKAVQRRYPSGRGSSAFPGPSQVLGRREHEGD